MLEAIASRLKLEAIASRLKAIAIRFEGIANTLETLQRFAGFGASFAMATGSLRNLPCRALE